MLNRASTFGAPGMSVKKSQRLPDSGLIDHFIAGHIHLQNTDPHSSAARHLRHTDSVDTHSSECGSLSKTSKMKGETKAFFRRSCTLCSSDPHDGRCCYHGMPERSIHIWTIPRSRVSRDGSHLVVLHAQRTTCRMQDEDCMGG